MTTRPAHLALAATALFAGGCGEEESLLPGGQVTGPAPECEDPGPFPKGADIGDDVASDWCADAYDFCICEADGDEAELEECMWICNG